MTDLSELLERVKAATGPDRELDGAIEVMARRFDAYRAGLDDTTRAHWKHNGSTVYDGNTGYVAANFTASIDAALALVERCLPGWMVAMGTCGENNMPWACITEPDEPCRDFASDGVDIPNAILSALLQALGEKP